MNAYLFRTERKQLSAHSSSDHQRYYSCDTEPPNHAAHRRGFVVILIVVGVAGCVALIGGMLQGVSDMGAAFPSGSALFEAAAWDRFFAGFGRVAALVFFLAAVVVIVRWCSRKPKRLALPKK